MSDDTGITRSMLSEQVKGRLLRAILDGTYPPGARIVETRVAKEFGTSQAPVREALRDLEALGVVESAPFKGARVRQPSTEELLEAFELCAILEGRGAALAMENMTEASFTALDELTEAMREAADEGDPYRAAMADAEFHRLIMWHSGNATLERVWRSLEPFLRTYATIVSPDVNRRAVAERHVPITNAMRLRDPALIEEAFQDYFEKAASTLAEGRLERRNRNGVDEQLETDALPRSSGAIKITVKP